MDERWRLIDLSDILNKHETVRQACEAVVLGGGKDNKTIMKVNGNMEEFNVRLDTREAIMETIYKKGGAGLPPEHIELLQKIMFVDPLTDMHEVMLKLDKYRGEIKVLFKLACMEGGGGSAVHSMSQARFHNI